MHRIFPRVHLPGTSCPLLSTSSLCFSVEEKVSLNSYFKTSGCFVLWNPWVAPRGHLIPTIPPRIFYPMDKSSLGQLATWTIRPRRIRHMIFCPMVNSSIYISPHDNSSHENSPIRPMKIISRQFCPVNNSPHGQLIPWTSRPMKAHPRQLAPWQLALWQFAYEQLPHRHLAPITTCPIRISSMHL
jgi:hypothetical protein